MTKASAIVDFHAHILPAADHGSGGISETKNQIAFYKKAGVDTIVATPHFYPNSVSIDAFLESVDSAAENLTQLLAAEEAPSPRVLLGAEVLYCENLHHIEGLEKLCIRGTDLLLLELPLSEWSPSLFHTVRELNKRCRVVLAHIDRYTRPHADNLLALVEAGVMVQVNAFSLYSYFERKRLAPFFACGSVVALGSDLHNTDASAVDKLVGVEKFLGADYAAIMSHASQLLSTAKSI